MPDSISAGRSPAIEVTGLVKSFGAVTALDGVDLTVEAGSLTALLGPNGAGKTTLVRIVSTLTRPDAGRVRVLGLDVSARPQQVRARIGLTGQFAGLDEGLTGQDNLLLIGRLAGLRRRDARRRAAELARLFDVTDAIGRTVRTYSGGMRRRLDLAASLMTRPALLVLDEPTTGLDPASRGQLWSALTELRDDGTTMLLTTQYLEEADRFADMVHVLSAGRIIASGTSARLRASVGGQVVEVRLADPAAAPAAVSVIGRRLRLPEAAIRSEAGLVRLAAADGVGTLLAVGAALQAEEFQVADMGLRQPSLDEAFLALTARTEIPA
jgi:daunorubicin resistance ABC transporter ATP-binding subunit